MSTGAEPRGRSASKRRAGRQMALQMLYQRELGGATTPQVLHHYNPVDLLEAVRDERPSDTLVRLRASRPRCARRSLTPTGSWRATASHLDELDELIREQAEHWRLERMSAVDRNVLRLAVFELLYEPDVPKLVVLDEAIELAKRFGSEQSGRVRQRPARRVAPQPPLPGEADVTVPSRAAVLAGLAALLLPATAGAALAQALALAGADRVRLELPAERSWSPTPTPAIACESKAAWPSSRSPCCRCAARHPFALPPAADGRRPARHPGARGGRRLDHPLRGRLAGCSPGWRRNVDYDLDRGAPQDALAVLGRRRGYCTGVARLTVALLQPWASPPARCLGFLVAPPGAGVPAGFHRWVEVHYDDVGWVFSDPLCRLPLRAGDLRPARQRDAPPGRRAPAPGRLLGARRTAAAPSTSSPRRRRGVTVRRNDAARQRPPRCTITVGDGRPRRPRRARGGRPPARSRPSTRRAAPSSGSSPATTCLRGRGRRREPGATKRVTLARPRVAARPTHLPSGRTRRRRAPRKETT